MSAYFCRLFNKAGDEQMEPLLCFLEAFEPNESREASVYPVYPCVGIAPVLCVALYVPDITVHVLACQANKPPSDSQGHGC